MTSSAQWSHSSASSSNNTKPQPALYHSTGPSFPLLRLSSSTSSTTPDDRCHQRTILILPASARFLPLPPLPDGSRNWRITLQPSPPSVIPSTFATLNNAYHRLRATLQHTPLWTTLSQSLRTHPWPRQISSALFLEPTALSPTCPPHATCPHSHSPEGLQYLTLFTAILAQLPKPPSTTKTAPFAIDVAVQDARNRLSSHDRHFLDSLGFRVIDADIFGRDVRVRGAFGAPVTSSALRGVGLGTFVFAPETAVWSGWAAPPALLVCRELGLVSAVLKGRIMRAEAGSADRRRWEAEDEALEAFRTASIEIG